MPVRISGFTWYGTCKMIYHPCVSNPETAQKNIGLLFSEDRVNAQIVRYLTVTVASL